MEHRQQGGTLKLDAMKWSFRAGERYLDYILNYIEYTLSTTKLDYVSSRVEKCECISIYQWYFEVLTSNV